ncbi:muts domain V-domain-containing protein [Vararia minispora EC-137]|uniref:Muts domain V-domain-containing protein n=1 Tax=Vararia minispora EC-137 TaxID=1314806 RepID=A0ACB8QYQ7_9AGAM|nr:muts domain V-domain-containing protein [Vararia minispora EC-137]
MIHANPPTDVRVAAVHEEQADCEDTSTAVVEALTGANSETIINNLAKFPHCLLLTRVGQFYESYFDQAVEISQMLNIKLTSRVFSRQRIHMCGFPLVHLHKHLKTLVQQKRCFVALCEEFIRPTPFGQKPTFERRVVRVITPGTLIDEPFLNQYENNYLLSIAPSPNQSPDVASAALPVGMAWIDVSTGEFFTRLTTADNLRDELVRIGPKEVVLPLDIKGDVSHPVFSPIAEEGCFVSHIEPTPASLHVSTPDATDFPDALFHGSEPEPSKTVVSLSAQETAAVELLTTYLHANLLENAPKLSTPSREETEARMQIDSHTIKALEIREGMREGGVTGSLLSVIKRTVTSGGTRLLARWLCSPSTSLLEIKSRQSLVSLFHSRVHLREDLVQLLHGNGDLTRVVQKFTLGRGDASDLLIISSTIAIWKTLKERINLERIMEAKERSEFIAEDWANLVALVGRLDSVEDLDVKIKSAIPVKDLVEDEEPTDEDGPDASALDNVDLNADFKLQNNLRFTVHPDFSEELTRLHQKLEELTLRKHEMEQMFKTAYSAPSLTLRSSLQHGVHVHIAKKRHASLVKASTASFVLIAESNSTASFFNGEWSRLGAQIAETVQELVYAEKHAFETLRSLVVSHEAVLRRNARIMDELDVALGFATLANEMQLVRPTLTEDLSFHVVNGRHPTVELGLLTSGRVFTPNTVYFSPDSRLHIITGPNMAGKSTLLRQTALIAILAQTGSFVPADSATMGVVDRLYSRVGAKDDLFRDRSTFMVEMLETSEILRRATSNSLVIMDEVGRGTTVKDGLAIAFATVHHLYSKNQCRTLFATHFHELTDMLGYTPDHKGEGLFKDIGFFCTDVDETEDGRFAYSHRLRPGVNRDSHGLKVAQLAGLPPEAVSVAQNALSWLKNNSGDSMFHRQRLKALGQSLASAELPGPAPS